MPEAKDGTELLHIIAQAVMEETGSSRPPHLSRDTTAGQIPGWDSLIHGRILILLEEKLEIQIDIDRTYDMPNMGELADYLASLRKTRES